MPFTFSPPTVTTSGAVHHGAAAMRNVDVTTSAIGALQDALDGAESYERLLLKAAAGAGKSFALRRLVHEAISHPDVSRVGVTAFANKQVFPLAAALGKELGASRVCLAVAPERLKDLPAGLSDVCTVAVTTKEVPEDAEVILGTTHKLQGTTRPAIGDCRLEKNSSPY